MILGVIEISLRSTRFSVTEIAPGSSRVRLDRSHGLTAGPDNVDRLTALLMAEVEVARELDVDRIEVVAVPELRGSRLVRLIDRVGDALGIGPVRIPSRRDTAAAAFLGVTEPRVEEIEGPVAVAHIGETSVGIAVGEPGLLPDWIGSRPVGASTMTRKARFANPPRPTQIEAAIAGASRGIGSLSPPECGRLFVNSPMAEVVGRLCGLTVGLSDAQRGLDAILGQTSADTAAWFGVEPALARHLPGILVGHAALAEGLGMRAEPVSCDHGAGRHWLAERELGVAGGDAR